MNRPLRTLVAFFCASGTFLGQEPQLPIIKLEATRYPPMALAARVSGDVILNVRLASDGSTSAVTVESGPAMLRPTAIDSATHSQFRGKTENGAGEYHLVYRFVLDQPTSCGHDDSYPRVKHDANAVTITEQAAMLCDPAFVIDTVRFRSAKCLYLWKCGSKPLQP